MTKLNWEKARKRDLLRKPRECVREKSFASGVKRSPASKFALGMFRAATLARLKELEVEKFGRSLGELGSKKLTTFVRLLTEHPKTRCALQSLDSGEAEFSFTAFDFSYAKSLLRTLEERPNKALEPTRTSVTPRACARVAPAARAAHL